MSTTKDRLERLEERLTELEQENERKDKIIEEQQERIDELEDRIELRGEDKKMENLWIHGLPVGMMLENRKSKVKDLEGRVEDIEKGEVDPGEVVANSSAGVDPSDLLPLHNMYLSAQNLDADEHDLSKNQEIAARLFPYLGQYAYTNEGRMFLPSTKVKDILEREIATPELCKRLDVEDPNANTVRRAMKFVGKFGKDMMEFDDSEKTNRIVIDREAWKEYTKEVTEIASSTDDSTVNSADDPVNAENTAEDAVDEVDNELEMLTNDSDYGVVSTDGGTAVNSDRGR